MSVPKQSKPRGKEGSACRRGECRAGDAGTPRIVTAGDTSGGDRPAALGALGSLCPEEPARKPLHVCLHHHPIFIVIPCPHGGAGLLSNYSGRGGTSEITLKIALSRRHSRAAADVRLSPLPSVPVPPTPLVAQSCPGAPQGPAPGRDSAAGSPGHTVPCAQPEPGSSLPVFHT